MSLWYGAMFKTHSWWMLPTEHDLYAKWMCQDHCRLRHFGRNHNIFVTVQCFGWQRGNQNRRGHDHRHRTTCGHNYGCKVWRSAATKLLRRPVNLRCILSTLHTCCTFGDCSLDDGIFVRHFRTCSWLLRDVEELWSLGAYTQIFIYCIPLAYPRIHCMEIANCSCQL